MGMPCQPSTRLYTTPNCVPLYTHHCVNDPTRTGVIAMLDGVLCVLHICVVSDGYSYDFVRICVMKPEPRREGYSILHNTICDGYLSMFELICVAGITGYLPNIPMHS